MLKRIIRKLLKHFWKRINMTNRKVICAGCSQIYQAEKTHFYRNKRCCGLDDCFRAIDRKIKHRNYLKQRRKFANGTHRRGVRSDLKNIILERDGYSCKTCSVQSDYLTVHHIVPVSDGGGDELNNLITLCTECHVKVHQEGAEKFVKLFTDYTKGVVNV